MLVAVDTRRPAAINQLKTLGKQVDIPVYSEDAELPHTAVCAHALSRARETATAWLVVDTAGRLHVDGVMMKELAGLKEELQPVEVLLVVDAMTGQDAVRVAEEFTSRVGLSGLILSKMDGDARGGAALSIRSVAGVPIKFIGTGEKPDDIEPFHPDRLAARILGMGDVLSLVEKVERVVERQQAEQLEKKLRAASFDLEDFRQQLQQVRRMGSLAQLVELIPGFSRVAGQLRPGEGEKQLRKIEAIIFSMTPEERHNPHIINGSRRRRIARGSGTTPQDINRLLNQFQQIQRLVKQMGGGKKISLPSLFR